MASPSCSESREVLFYFEWEAQGNLISFFFFFFFGDHNNFGTMYHAFPIVVPFVLYISHCIY